MYQEIRSSSSPTQEPTAADVCRLIEAAVCSCIDQDSFSDVIAALAKKATPQEFLMLEVLPEYLRRQVPILEAARDIAEERILAEVAECLKFSFQYVGDFELSESLDANRALGNSLPFASSLVVVRLENANIIDSDGNTIIVRENSSCFLSKAKQNCTALYFQYVSLLTQLTHQTDGFTIGTVVEAGLKNLYVEGPYTLDEREQRTSCLNILKIGNSCNLSDDFEDSDEFEDLVLAFTRKLEAELLRLESSLKEDGYAEVAHIFGESITLLESVAAQEESAEFFALVLEKFCVLEESEDILESETEDISDVDDCHDNEFALPELSAWEGRDTSEDDSIEFQETEESVSPTFDIEVRGVAPALVGLSRLNLDAAEPYVQRFLRDALGIGSSLGFIPNPAHIVVMANLIADEETFNFVRDTLRAYFEDDEQVELNFSDMMSTLIATSEGSPFVNLTEEQKESLIDLYAEFSD